MTTALHPRMCVPRLTTAPVDRTAADAPGRLSGLAGEVFDPWSLRVGRTTLLVRPVGTRDLHRVATLHARSSARTLLDRYRAGGRGPAPAALERMLRRPLNFAAVLPTGAIVAHATVGADLLHGGSTAELGVLVTDAWQGNGIGRELVVHAAAAATVFGYAEVVAYPGTTLAVADALLSPVGSTRFARDAAGVHLHTYLPEAAALGLGAVRRQLAS